MSYLRVGQNVEMKVGCKYRERPMIKKKDVFIIMISCGLTYIGVMSVCMQEINERVVTKSTKKHLNQIPSIPLFQLPTELLDVYFF